MSIDTSFDIQEGDCLELLKDIPSDSINLIVTSPPYGKQRKETYGGIDPDIYVDWFLPRAEEMNRVLKPSGSFILNIWEHVANRERHTYVLELVLALKQAGWKWIEEYIWRKTNPMPGKYMFRVRDAWEHVYHFAKTTDLRVYQDAVLIPARWKYTTAAKNTGHRSANGSGLSTGPRRVRSNDSGFGATDESFVSDMVLPHNVIETTIGSNKGSKRHPAVFPREIPEFFIKFCTVPGDIVLDPFAGSGTTLFVAYDMYRKVIGMEIVPEYCDYISNEFSKKTELFPFEWS